MNKYVLPILIMLLGTAYVFVPSYLDYYWTISNGVIAFGMLLMMGYLGSFQKWQQRMFVVMLILYALFFLLIFLEEKDVLLKNKGLDYIGEALVFAFFCKGLKIIYQILYAILALSLYFRTDMDITRGKRFLYLLLMGIIWFVAVKVTLLFEEHYYHAIYEPREYASLYVEETDFNRDFREDREQRMQQCPICKITRK